MAVSIFFLLILLAALLFVVVYYILGGMLGPAFNRYNPFLSASALEPDPTCGACGYPTHGISSFECPECGADLREVGIKTPEMRHAGRRGAAAGCVLPIVWTVGLFFGGALLGNAASGWLPRKQVADYSVQLGPNSSAYNTLTLDAQYLGPATQHAMHASSSSHSGGATWLDLGYRPTSMHLSRFVIRLPFVAGPSPGPRHFEIDPPQNTFRYENGNGQWVTGTGQPKPHDFFSWYLSNGLPISRFSPVRSEAAELANIYDAMHAKQPDFNLTQFKSTASSYRLGVAPVPTGWRVGYLLLCFVVWVAGLALLARPPKQKTNNN